MNERIQEALRRRHRKGDEGFTLIELLVVILIIAILAAVGIVALLNALNAGRKSSATTVVRNAITSVKSWQGSQGVTDYSGIGDATTGLTATEPDISFVNETTVPQKGKNFLSIDDTTSTTVVILAALSQKDVCYMAKLDSNAGTAYGSSADAGATCTASLVPDTGWVKDQKTGWAN